MSLISSKMFFSPDNIAIIFTNAPTETNNSSTIEWESSVPAFFECSLDSAPFTSCDGLNLLRRRGLWMGTGLTSGDHTLVVRARDANGNEGEQSHSWFVGKYILLCSEPFS